MATHPRPTRGGGLLEPWLARLRSQRANSMIPPALRKGRVLDIGCGSYPYFLAHTHFKERYAIDQAEPAQARDGAIFWHQINLDTVETLPFPDDFFSVSTMLAVVEHLDPDRVVQLVSEIRRCLTPDGLFILTTPSVFAHRLLRIMAALRLVSGEEIREHAFAYSPMILDWTLTKAGFSREKVTLGSFELGLNLWVVAAR